MMRLREDDLDSYSRLAVSMILARFPDWEAFATVESRPDGEGGVVEFNIPCPSPAAEHGLWVSTADEEFSVGFHTHHSHFTDYTDGTHIRQIEAGVEHAADLVAERVGVVSWYNDGGFVGSSSVELPHLGPLRGLLISDVPIASVFARCERVTLRSWLGRYDRDEPEAEPPAAPDRGGQKNTNNIKVPSAAAAGERNRSPSPKYFAIAQMKFRWIIAVPVVLVCITISAVFLSKPLQIEYHKYALERLHDDIYAEPTVISGGLAGYGDGDQFERQDKHCNRLAALGYFFRKRYEMENLPDTDEVHSAVWRLIQKEFPDRRYPMLSYPDNVLEVWDLAEYESKWDAFVAKHNVPDFADRFLARADDGEPSHAPKPAAEPDSNRESSPPAR